jgi:formyl-CoA transferase
MMRPLAGTVVLDFTQVMMGPIATQTLGDYGADVIKIERPGTGDLSRRGVLAHQGMDNPVFLALNRNKRGVALDLSTDAGREVAESLIARADVVVSNFRPGVMERLGLGYEDARRINPRIIWAAGSGFGPSGPYAHKGGQDVLGQAYSGVMKRTPDPDAPVSVYATAIADYTAGQHLVQGILLALLHRERTGEGQQVEVSLYNSMLAIQAQEATARLMYDVELNWAMMPLTGCFATSDSELVIIGAFKENPLQRICTALELPDLSADPRFAELEGQRENRAELREIIGARLSERGTADWLAALEEQDVLCGPVLTLAEALASEQTEVNRMLLEFPDADGRVIRTIASPIRMSSSVPDVRVVPPRLGQHTEQVLSESGYSEEQIRRLVADGIVQ